MNRARHSRHFKNLRHCLFTEGGELLGGERPALVEPCRPSDSLKGPFRSVGPGHLGDLGLSAEALPPTRVSAVSVGPLAGSDGPGDRVELFSGLVYVNQSTCTEFDGCKQNKYIQTSLRRKNKRKPVHPQALGKDSPATGRSLEGPGVTLSTPLTSVPNSIPLTSLPHWVSCYPAHWGRVSYPGPPVIWLATSRLSLSP